MPSLEEILIDSLTKLYTEADITPKDGFKFITNELKSIVNTYKIEFTEIPVELARILLAFRKTRRITNSQVKEVITDYLIDKELIEGTRKSDWVKEVIVRLLEEPSGPDH